MSELLNTQRRVARIKGEYADEGTISPEDLDFLCDSAVRKVIFEEIAESDWTKLTILKTITDLEIEELKRQVATLSSQLE